MATNARDLVSITAALAAGGRESTRTLGYDRALFTAGIAHIGVGNIHRAHGAVSIDDLLASRDDQNEWGIVGIGLRGGGYNLDEQTGEFRADHPAIRQDLVRAHPQPVFAVLAAALVARRAGGARDARDPARPGQGSEANARIWGG